MAKLCVILYKVYLTRNSIDIFLYKRLDSILWHICLWFAFIFLSNVPTRIRILIVIYGCIEDFVYLFICYWFAFIFLSYVGSNFSWLYEFVQVPTQIRIIIEIYGYLNFYQVLIWYLLHRNGCFSWSNVISSESENPAFFRFWIKIMLDSCSSH